MKRHVEKFNERVENVERALSHLQSGCIYVPCDQCRLNKGSELCIVLKNRISTVG